MNISTFREEWGFPDEDNFAVSCSEYSGDCFLSIFKPRHGVVEEVVINNCSRWDIYDYLWGSVNVVSKGLGFNALPLEALEKEEQT